MAIGRGRGARLTAREQSSGNGDGVKGKGVCVVIGRFGDAVARSLRRKKGLVGETEQDRGRPKGRRRAWASAAGAAARACANERAAASSVMEHQQMALRYGSCVTCIDVDGQSGCARARTHVARPCARTRACVRACVRMFLRACVRAFVIAIFMCVCATRHGAGSVLYFQCARACAVVRTTIEYKHELKRRSSPRHGEEKRAN
eukprot:6205435-Pleurochrysis_carterae.AAC.1